METISMASGATYFNSPAVAREAAIAGIQKHKTYYGLAQGTPELREALADRYWKLNQVKISPEQILISPGTKMALYTILSQILKPGDEIIIPVPNWFGLHQILLKLQAVPVYLPTHLADNYDIDPDKLASLITAKTRLFLFCNPCNPTGRIYTTAEISSLLAVLTPYPDIYILSDEIYDMVTFGQRVPSLTEFPDPAGKHLVVNGFSKSFAMSGWRIGYAILPPALVEPSTTFQDIIYSGVSEFVQDAALHTLNNLETILPPMLAVLAQNKTRLMEFLTRLQIPFFAPEAAYYIFPDLSEYLKGEINTSLKLCQYLLEEFKIELRCGEFFGAPGYARISFALEPNTFEEALKRLKSGLESNITLPVSSGLI